MLVDNKARDHWRYGIPPMFYASRCMSLLISISGERLTEVVCHGWSPGGDAYDNNAYRNPFGKETAQFKTSRGHAFKARLWHTGAEPGAPATGTAAR